MSEYSGIDFDRLCEIAPRLSTKPPDSLDDDACLALALAVLDTAIADWRMLIRLTECGAVAPGKNPISYKGIRAYFRRSDLCDATFAVSASHIPEDILALLERERQEAEDAIAWVFGHPRNRDRNRDIWTRHASGQKDSKIAEALGLSKQTVQGVIRRVGGNFEKNSRTGEGHRAGAGAQG